MDSRNGLFPLLFIALGAAALTALFEAAAILVPLVGTLALVYFAFTTPPLPPSR
jgi:hypothetical protein